MDIATTTINAIRVLSAEAIQKANSGHPGLPLGSAPIGYTLFADHLKFDPTDPKWADRDRFVLSAGHGSMLLYSLLYLFGYDLTMEDLKNFRQLGRTPGHPEYGVTPGVETTTGPLGQGIASAVGMAAAEAHLAGVFNREGFPVVDHYTYVLCGDGCLEEGISYEACSFAGAHKLGKLILLYDDNAITIEGSTLHTFKEDVAKRFQAQEWQVLCVEDGNDIRAIHSAISEAKADTTRPSIIICKTQIGYGAPGAGTAKVHGAPLGEEGIAALKKNLNWDHGPFEVPDQVLAHCAEAGKRGQAQAARWHALMEDYRRAYPDLARKFAAYMDDELPDLENMDGLFAFSKPEATRNTSHMVLNKLAAHIPNLFGGSADLAPSNKSDMKDRGFFSAEDRTGSNVHFGIREHAMAAITNGVQLHGGLRGYCATFFVFCDYMKHAMRLSALMDQPVIYVLTHDSIGVGEDGATHQPVEQLVALRSIPNLKVFRPADGSETACAWICALTGHAPTAIVLSRQTLPQYEGSKKNALKGGYILSDCEGTPDVLLIGTGSEVEQCVQAQKLLSDKGIAARVISMPCMEVFEQQSTAYKSSVIPGDVEARVCVEAGSPYSWYRYAGKHGQIVAMEGFGASAPAKQLFKMYGFTAENIAEKALISLAAVKDRR